MADSYYDSQIEIEQKKLNVTARLIDVAMNYLVAKNNRKTNNLRAAWSKVKYASNDKERNARLKTFLKVLNEDRAFREKVISSTDVSKALRERFRGTDIELEYSEYSNYGYEIGSHAKEAVAKFARDYVDTIRKIDLLKRQKDKDIKKATSNETTKLENSSREGLDQSYSTVFATIPSHRLEEVESHDVKVGNKVIFHESDSLETREEKAMKYLEEKVTATRERGFGKFFLTTEEEKMLRSVLGDGKYLHVGTLVEEGLAIQDILYRMEKFERNSLVPFKKNGYTPNLGDVCDAALGVYDNLPEELMLPTYALNPEENYELKLRNMSGIGHSLESYEKIYNIYLNYFNKLSQEEKDKLKSTFMTNGAYEYYKKKFNISSFEIISPDKLKVFVNNRVKEKMLDNYLNYLDRDANIYNALCRAAKFMEVSDIVNVYARIKTKYNTYFTVMPGDDEQKQIEASNRNLAALQENFANAILRKMNLGNLSVAERNRKLEYIVQELLHEKPLFEIGTTTLTQGELDDSKSTDMTEDKKQSRLFGFDRLRKVAVDVSEKWHKLRGITKGNGDLSQSENNDMNLTLRR